MALFFHQLDFFDIAVENIGNNSYYIEKTLKKIQYAINLYNV